MSHCSIKSRKAKVKLIYENNFDFSFNDPNECVFESARNEIKLMLQQELEFFLSKLKLKINDIEIPFLSNCEKCRTFNETTDVSDNKFKTMPGNEFDEIFHMILDGNTTNNNANNAHKKHNAHQHGNQHNNNNNYFNNIPQNKDAHNQQHGNTISSLPGQNFSIKDVNAEALGHNLNLQNADNNAKEANNLNKSGNAQIDFLKPKHFDSAPTGANNNNSSMEQNNTLNNFIENSPNRNSLISEKPLKEKEGAILESHNANNLNKNNLSSNLLEKDYFEKNTNLKEEGHEDDLSSIHSSHLEPNFLKGNINRHNIEGGASLNSYENLTVLEEGKFDKETDFQEKSGYEAHFQGAGSQKKMKIGCFMEDDTGKQIDLLICDNFKSRYESSIHPNILKNTSQFFSMKQLNLLEKNKCVNNNHKIYLLYGNIAYSMGSYHKAQKFYQTGINTIIEENKDNPNSLDYVIFKCLLQNNLAKCLINCLNIKPAITVLETAVNTLNEKLSFLHESESNNNNNNNNPLEPNQNTNNNANNNNNNNSYNKNLIYKFKLLKFIIEFNLAETYFFLEEYKQSHTILDRIFEELTSESTLGYYESHNIADLSYDDKELSKFFVKYYYICGKIQFRLDNMQLAMDSFTQSINLRGEEKNEHKEDLAQIYSYVALIYCKQNQFEKALKYINKALNIYWLLYGEDHIKTNMVQLNLSYIQKMKGENLKCLETLNKIRENFVQSKEAEKVFGAVIYRAIGTCYFEMENEIKGLTFYTKANNIYKKYFISNKVTMSEINSIILNLFGLINV